MIEKKYYQRQLGEGFIHDSIDDCWEPWMKIADEILDDEELIEPVYEALRQRRPKSATRGRIGTPAEVAVRMLARITRTKGQKQTKEKLQAGYKRLLNATGQVVAQAKRIADEIKRGVKKSRNRSYQLRLATLRSELERMIPLVQQVMRQAKARVFRNDLHAADKLVSSFETATQIIRKGKSAKPTEFGRLIKIQEAENQASCHDRLPALEA